MKQRTKRIGFIKYTACMALGAALTAGCAPDASDQPAEKSTGEVQVTQADGKLNDKVAPQSVRTVEQPPAPASTFALSPDGFGPLRIGMTIAEASRALGTELAPTSEYEQDSCRHYGSADLPPDLVLMGQNGRITRVTIHQSSKLKTDRGLGLGVSEAEVRGAYDGKIETEVHHYLGEPAHYLTSWSAKTKRGVRYETDREGVVREIHAGDESIRLVEACS